MIKPEVVDQDQDTITIKIPNGMKFELIKISRASLPKFIEQLEIELKIQGNIN